MAITDWNLAKYGNFTPFIGNTKADRESAYVGINPQYTQGFNWQDPNSQINLGGTSFANPYQYQNANGMAGTPDGMEGWSRFGEGDQGYFARADSQQNGGVIGQLGPDNVEGNAYYSAPTGQRFLAPIMESDPELWNVLKPYANAYGSWTPEHGYTIPEEYYKTATGGLGRWTTKGDWKGPASILAMIGGAVGGQLLGAGASLGDIGSAFPSAAGDSFYNWANVASGGGGAGIGGGAGGSLLDSAAYGINPATGSAYQMPLPMGANGAPVLPTNGQWANFAINPTTGLPMSMPLPSGGIAGSSDPSTWVGGDGGSVTPQGLGQWNAGNIPADYFQNLALGGTGVGAEATAATSLWDQIKGAYNSPEAQIAKTIGSGTQSALSAAQQMGLLGGQQAPSGGGGGLLGASGGGRGRSFAELSPYARGLLRG